MLRYGLLKYSIHLMCFMGSVGGFEIKKMIVLKNLGTKRRWIIRIFVIF